MATLGYDNGDTFIRALSSFWSVVYKDKDLIRKFMSGYGENFSDAYFNFLETILGVSIQEIPVFSRHKWYFLKFLESDNLGQATLIYKDEGIVYGSQPDDSIYTPVKVFRYGENFSSDTLFRWKLPRKIVDVDRFLMNRIHSPSLVLTKDTDFTIDTKKKTITFNFNPFEESKIAAREIRDGKGKLIDREIGFWALNSYWDYELVYENFGKLVDFYKPSSEVYKTFVRAIWDLFLGGPSFQNVEAAINAVLGLPITGDHETLQEIIKEDGINNIVTDLNVYKIPVEVPIKAEFFSEDGLLKPNITLVPFTPLTSVITIKDSVSHPRWWNDVNPMIIPKNLIYDQVDFFLPENILVYADMIVGRTFGLPPEITAPNDYLKTLGLRVGEWVIGGSSKKFDYKNYIMENFFKENIFFLSISPTVTQLPNFEKQVANIIFDAIPAYTTFINYTFLDTILDDYHPSLSPVLSATLDTVSSQVYFDGVQRTVNTNIDVSVLDIGSGVVLTDDGSELNEPGVSTTTDLAYEDGYFGVPYAGFVVIGGFTIGTLGFQNGLLVRSVCGN